MLLLVAMPASTKAIPAPPCGAHLARTLRRVRREELPKRRRLAATSPAALLLDWLLNLEVHGSLPAAFLLNMVDDLLTLIETGQSCALDSTDMDEHVLAAAVRLNEPKPFVALNHLAVPVALGLFPVSRRLPCGR